MSDRELQTHLGEKFGASVNYWDQLGKCDRIYHNYDKYPQGGWHRYSYYVTDNTLYNEDKWNIFISIVVRLLPLL